MPSDPLSEPRLDLREYVRDIPDFPRQGIVFRDITPMLVAPKALDYAIAALARACAALAPVDYVVAAEARGFILGAAVAREIGAGFVPARKHGKLPSRTVRAEYALEYGLDALEVPADAFADGARVVVHDDLLATGGTADALCKLVSELGADVAGCAFIVELSDLGGRARLAPHEVTALISYD